MKMTSRERVMIIFLLIAAVLAGSYYLVLTPQMEKIDNLKADQEDLSIQVNSVTAELASIARLRQGVDDMVDQIEAETENFFPSILTEKLLIVLNDLIIQNGLVVNSADFSSPNAAVGS